jgi:hypothetical protein
MCMCLRSYKSKSLLRVYCAFLCSSEFVRAGVLRLTCVHILFAVILHAAPIAAGVGGGVVIIGAAVATVCYLKRRRALAAKSTAASNSV